MPKVIYEIGYWTLMFKHQHLSFKHQHFEFMNSTPGYLRNFLFGGSGKLKGIAPNSLLKCSELVLFGRTRLYSIAHITS